MMLSGYGFAATGLTHQADRFFAAHIETDPIHRSRNFILTAKVNFQIFY